MLKHDAGIASEPASWQESSAEHQKQSPSRDFWLVHRLHMPLVDPEYLEHAEVAEGEGLDDDGDGLDGEGEAGPGEAGPGDAGPGPGDAGPGAGVAGPRVGAEDGVGDGFDDDELDGRADEWLSGMAIRPPRARSSPAGR
jgi:hypothetical protein